MIRFQPINHIVFSLTAIILPTLANLEACTGIQLQSKDGKYVNGRTLEFGIKLETSVGVVPRGFEFTGTTPLGKGLTYKAKYGVVGAFLFSVPAILDGINEKGLSVGTFFFPDFAKYGNTTPENQSKSVSPFEFPNWVVTQFATVDEVKAALPSIEIAPTVLKEWANLVPAFHYVVYDKSGKCLSIEPIDGKLVATDNPFGVYTNSPSIDWHLENLRNFINLTPVNAKPVEFRGLTLKPFGEGSGMVGLPGDFTPPSRFVRAAIFTISATPADISNEAVAQAFHILNQFDIPVGAIQGKVGNVEITDYTMLTCVKDPGALKYYYKTYDDQTIRVIDLNKFDLDAKAIKKVDANAFKEHVVDISSALK